MIPTLRPRDRAAPSASVIPEDLRPDTLLPADEPHNAAARQRLRDAQLVSCHHFITCRLDPGAQARTLLYESVRNASDVDQIPRLVLLHARRGGGERRTSSGTGPVGPCGPCG